jgi:hypothetical protein
MFAVTGNTAASNAPMHVQRLCSGSARRHNYTQRSNEILKLP